MRGRILAAAACAALAAVAAPVFAQPAPPITWVAYTQGKAGKTSDWVKLTLKYDAPIYEKLMAAGVVRSWGIATPINHRPGFEWNLLTWVTVDNWAGVEKWAGASMQTMQARSAEETKAIESSFDAVEQGRSHFDEVVRNAVLVPGKPGAKTGYFLVGHFLARPGQDAAATQFYKDLIVPIADKLVADGTIVGYGLHVQELHGQFQPDRKWTHRSWYAVPDLAAIDRIQAAIQAAITPQFMTRAAEVFDMAAHSDDVLMVLHQGAPPAPAAAPAKK
jgi:hypothetical protein